MGFNSAFKGLRASGYSAQSCNTTSFQKSSVNVGVKLYNRLLERIKTLNDFKSLKKNVKFSLLNNSVYTIKEFLQLYRS